MSVSSHLTPEPERRLWLILENMQQAVATADRRIAALTGLALAEAAFLVLAQLAGAAALGALAAAAVALPLGVLAYSPLERLPKWLGFLDAPRGKPNPDDSMVAVEDVVKYAYGELIHKLDKYLGGGITATQYYEDIVAQILRHARAAARKRKLLRLSCLIVGLGQLLLLAALLRP